MLREYNDDYVDLWVKVPSGKIKVKRWFYEDHWLWDHIQRNRLTFRWDTLGERIVSIDKGGVIYNASSSDANVYINDDVYRIVRTEEGYRWHNRRGEWKIFDTSGRMTSYGTLKGLVGKLLYEPGEDGKIIGVAANWFASAIGKVVTRKLPRELIRDLMVSATNGDCDLMSKTPLKSSGNMGL